VLNVTHGSAGLGEMELFVSPQGVASLRSLELGLILRVGGVGDGAWRGTLRSSSVGDGHAIVAIRVQGLIL
jgi:hypothetical protein